MNLSLPGYINNSVHLAAKDCLLPLFEAIVNSIHAIEDARDDGGVITVHVLREVDSVINDPSVGNPVNGFEIIDNGVGFNDSNHNSFNTFSSEYKVKKGGKGLGRFSWLKAFGKVEIDSIFQQHGKFMQRKFSFALEEDPIKELSFQECDKKENSTKVKLLDYKSPLKENVPATIEALINKTIEHHIEFFALGKMPQLFFKDSHNGETYNLNQRYGEWLNAKEVTDFKIGENDFQIKHFMLRARGNMTHRLYLNANQRVVIDKPITNQLSNLPKRVVSSKTNDEQGAISGKSLVYAGYLSGDFLDKNVDSNRTGFNISQEDSSDVYSTPSIENIVNAALKESTSFLERYTKPVKEEKDSKIIDWVYSNAPQYRKLLKHHPEALDSIPPNAAEEKYGTYLYDALRLVEIGLNKTAKNILASDDTVADKKYRKFLEEWNDIAKAKLAEYIVKRRTTLALLQQGIKRQEDGKFVLEEVIHKMIFPLRKTSDDLEYEDHNLWVIDERLAYHAYLASDLTLKKTAMLDSESTKEPDILIFQGPVAVTEGNVPANGITIIEFKRPMRDDYSPSNNPIDQVLGYVKKIRQGKARDRGGQNLPFNDNTPFYCYIVADLTEHLKDQADQMSFFPTNDGEGYVGYVRNYNAYFEIMGFNKLLRDARNRNQILFDKLGIRN